jgi:hypothetical protein
LAISQAAHDAEVADLRSQIKDLEDILGLHEHHLGTAFRLPAALTKLMGLLMAQPTVTPEMVSQRLRIATDAKVAFHRLRHMLEPYGIEVQSKRSLGYWFDDETKAKIRRIVTGKVTPVTGIAA